MKPDPTLRHLLIAGLIVPGAVAIGVVTLAAWALSFAAGLPR